MNVEKELKKTMFDPLYATTSEVNCATEIASNAMEYWVKGRKPCPKCGSFHTQKNIVMYLTSYPCQYHFRCMDCSHEWTDYDYDNELSYQPQFENPNPHKEYGWICPKCGRVYAPHMSWCTNCNGTYSPNFVYCGTTSNIGDYSISNTTAEMARNAIHEELQDSIRNSKK